MNTTNNSIVYPSDIPVVQGGHAPQMSIPDVARNISEKLNEIERTVIYLESTILGTGTACDVTPEGSDCLVNALHITNDRLQVVACKLEHLADRFR